MVISLSMIFFHNRHFFMNNSDGIIIGFILTLYHTLYQGLIYFCVKKTGDIRIMKNLRANSPWSKKEYIIFRTKNLGG